jgi:hypothetical protein
VTLRQQSDSLAELLNWQRKHDMADVHLVNVREDGFDLAHTDGERRAGIDLEDCPVHRWLTGLSGPPAASGRYQVLNHEPDQYSEPWGAEPYDLEAV